MNMRCANCNKRIESPVAFCPQCGAEIPEADREQLRNEIRKQQVEDAEIRRKWKKLEISSIIELLAGPFVVFPITLYIGLRYNLMWLFILFACLWVFGFIFLGFIKGGFRCPFCGGVLGNVVGQNCPHCSKQFR